MYFYVGMAAAQWLGLRLQAIASVLVTLVALLAVLGHEDLLPFATASSKFAASKAILVLFACISCIVGLVLPFARFAQSTKCTSDEERFFTKLAEVCINDLADSYPTNSINNHLQSALTASHVHAVHHIFTATAVLLTVATPSTLHTCQN